MFSAYFLSAGNSILTPRGRAIISGHDVQKRGIQDRQKERTQYFLEVVVPQGALGPIRRIDRWCVSSASGNLNYLVRRINDKNTVCNGCEASKLWLSSQSFRNQSLRSDGTSLNGLFSSQSSETRNRKVVRVETVSRPPR